MTLASHTTEIVYPDSDGRRMAENTLQAEWILKVFGNLAILYDRRPDVFVAMDNLWYPVEGKPRRRAAPDVYVVFGRPKGRRGSYRQWEENDIPLHVVFEVLSPGNRWREMGRKFRFYQRYGVEEYYVIDPDNHTFEAWHRSDGRLRSVRVNGGLVSPRMGVRFDKQPWENVVISYPDGMPFLSVPEIAAARDQAEQELSATRSQLEDTRSELSAVETRAAALAAKLRALGIDPDAV